MDQLTHIGSPPAPRSFGVPFGTDRVTRVILVGSLLSTAMLALLAATQLINYGVFDLRISALDTDTHRSVFGVVSLLAEAGAAGAIWWRSTGERRRAAWLVLGALVAITLPIRASGSLNAVLVGVPLVCVFCLVCWLTWRDATAPRAVVWAALVLMGISLLLHRYGLDADVLNYSNQSWAYQLTAVAKHGCELVGWMLLATGIIAGAANRRAST